MTTLTIVIPVFNTAHYLEKTFSCIKNQTLGIENMEVIIINDGSSDASAEICRNFQNSYKKNVHYIEFMQNQGVSYARNMALDMAQGKYITFWDSDDLWSQNAMEAACAFLEVYGYETDMVFANIEFFDGETGPHRLNFEVSENKIIDIHRDYHKIRSNGPTCVIKTEIAKLYRFDESQSCWEDTKYVNQLLLRKQKYGMLSDVTYYYRRRKSRDSASQSYTRKKTYYLHDLDALYQGVYKESVKQCGKCIPMIQYLLAYALGYRFAEAITILNEEERSRYDNVRREILSHVEDKYLQEITNVDSLVKWKMFAFKHGWNIEKEVDEWRKKEDENRWITERLDRTKTNYNILKRWFALKQQNKTLSTYFEKNGYYQIAIYGMSDLGMHLREELASTPVQVICGIDQRADRLTADFPILTVEDTLPEADAVVVTAVYFFRKIREILKDKVSCPVISLEEILDVQEGYRAGEI